MVFLQLCQVEGAHVKNLNARKSIASVIMLDINVHKIVNVTIVIMASQTWIITTRREEFK
jgi:hypothetical protein